METGAPAFVVLGPEALGMSSAPTDIKLLPDGRVFVVSQRDIAFGDGMRWDTFRAAEDDASIFSTVAVDTDGEIYAGIEGGIARIQLNEGSNWQLKPVMRLPEKVATQNSALISVTSIGKDWYWYGGNGAIVTWRPGSEPKNEGQMSGIDRIFALGSNVFVSDEASGALFRLGGNNTMVHVNPTTMLVSAGITCAIPFSPGKLLVGTGSSGFRLFDGEKFESFGKPGLLGRGFRITDLCAIGDSYFAAAIDSLGVIFFDREGQLVQVLERSLDHRLARARRLVYSNTGVLWALLNDGVARVQFPSPISNFAPLVPSGMQYALPMRHDGKLWLLADGRAMRGNYDEHGRLEGFTDDTPPGDYLFTLGEVGDSLYSCNEKGIYALEDSDWRLILPGAVNARVGVATPKGGGVAYVARGEFGVIRKTGASHTAERFPMPELSDSYGSHVDAQGIGWLELGTSRVGRIDLTGDVPSMRIFGPDTGLRTTGWVEIYVLDGIARFHVSGHLYRFDDEREAFIEDRELLSRMPQLAIATGRPVTDNLGRLWCTVDGTMRVIDRNSPSGNATVNITPVAFSPTSYTIEENGVVWMFERGRLARLDPRVPEPPESPLKAQITMIHFSTSIRDEINPGAKIAPINYTDNSLVFNFAAPANPFGTPVTFEVMLEGSSNTWVSTGTVGAAVFNRLKEGKYVFRVRPVRSGGIHGAEASVAFTILPPWYRTTAAWVAYTCIALAVLGFVMWLSSFLQRRENERLEHLVTQRTAELSASNDHLGRQIEETTRKTLALSASEERYRELNTELENRVRQRTSELEDAHQQLVAASRKAGMAEVATGVLHNVGNVLNSVNVSATLVRDTLRSSEITTLERVAGLIRENSANIADYLSSDPKGRHVPEFVMQLTTQLSKEHAVLQTENEQLARNVEHIKGIVAMQQSYATTSGVMEEVSPSHLVRDAIQMHAGSLQRHGIEFLIDAADLPPVTLDKHKVLQILVNLIQNAKHAIRDSGRSDGRIEVEIGIGDDDRIRISVSDNGVGIPAENLVRIFSHGFTTRANGHGFGLHSGANAAREMGGSLRAESAGPGKGAKFTLEVPVGVARAIA
jgi:signal transduction histidine kinase